MNNHKLISNSKSKNTGRSIIWGVINRIVNILLSFIVRTVIIYYLGIEFAGLSSLFTSILSVLSLAELGFGYAIVFSMYKPVADNDITKVNAYINYYKKCYRLIGITILVIGVILLPFLPHLVNGECPPSINLYILYVIYLINTVLGYFMFAYRAAIFTATQRNDIISNIGTFVLLMTNILQIILLMIFKNFYVYVVVMPVMTLISNYMTFYYSQKLFPSVKATGEITSKERCSIIGKVKGLILQRIGSIILTSVDTIVISIYFDLTSLGKYNNYYYVIVALFAFFDVIQKSLIPSIGNSIQTESIETNYKQFKFFHFLYIICNIFCTACLVSLLQDFMRIWIGESLLLDSTMVILFCTYFYTHKMSDICSVYRFAGGLWERWKIVPLIAALVNLSFNLVLIHYIGLYGIALSTIIALVVVYLPFYCFPVFKFYFKSVKKYITYIIMQVIYFISMMVISCTTYFITKNIKVECVIDFIQKSLVTVFITAILILVYIHLSGYKHKIIFLAKQILTRNK